MKIRLSEKWNTCVFFPWKCMCSSVVIFSLFFLIPQQKKSDFYYYSETFLWCYLLQKYTNTFSFQKGTGFHIKLILITRPRQDCECCMPLTSQESISNKKCTCFLAERCITISLNWSYLSSLLNANTDSNTVT